MMLVRTLLYHSIILILYPTSPISIGLQTVVFKKDISIQCSLLLAPLLSFDGTLNSRPEVGTELDSRPEVDTDLEMDEITTELEDSDTDYMTDVADTIER